MQQKPSPIPIIPPAPAGSPGCYAAHRLGRPVLWLVGLALLVACRRSGEPLVTSTGSTVANAEDGSRVEAYPVPPRAGGSRAGCDADAEPPSGCDYTEQVCIGGRCESCGRGTVALITQCAKTCAADRDCPAPLVCIFVAGDLSVCSPPAPKKACPRGQIWLRSDGSCSRTCKTDRDCPKDRCCLTDPNAPVPICMGKCP